MKFKVGNTIYCHTDVIMRDGGERTVTAGKTYTIIKCCDDAFLSQNRSFYIRNDYGRSHSFNYRDSSRWFNHPNMEPSKHIKKFEL